MRILLCLPAVRILPQRFCFRYSNTVIMPINGIYRSAHIMMKDKISSGSGPLRNFCTQLCGNFSHQSKYVTNLSSRELTNSDYRENKQMVKSFASHRQKSTDDKFVPLPAIEEIYEELMTAPKWLTNDEWSAVGMKFHMDIFLSSLWPTLLLHFIVQKTEAVPGLYSVGMSLVEYIASLSDRHRLLRLVSAIAIHIHQGDENDHEKALALYDEFCAEFDVLDHRSARILIASLSRTRYWRRCMQLIDLMKITAEPGSRDYSPIIIAAMINQDDNLANELLAALSRNGLVPDDEVFLHMLACGTVKHVLTVLKNFAWIPSRPVTDSVIAQFERYTIYTAVSVCALLELTSASARHKPAIWRMQLKLCSTLAPFPMDCTYFCL